MNKRLCGLDFLKIAATILIVFHHYQQIVGTAYGADVFSVNFDLSLMVELFFIISGYLMYRYIGLIESGLSFPQFYIKRFLRFFPILTICAITMTVFAYLYKSLYGEFYFGVDTYSLWTILITSLGIQEGWGITNPGINNPTWYISYLMLCYIFFYCSGIYWT